MILKLNNFVDLDDLDDFVDFVDLDDLGDFVDFVDLDDLDDLVSTNQNAGFWTK